MTKFIYWQTTTVDSPAQLVTYKFNLPLLRGILHKKVSLGFSKARFRESRYILWPLPGDPVLTRHRVQLYILPLGRDEKALSEWLAYNTISTNSSPLFTVFKLLNVYQKFVLFLFFCFPLHNRRIIKRPDGHNDNDLILILRAFHEMIKRALHDFYL